MKNIVTSLKNQKDRIKNAAGSVLENTGNKLDQIGELDTNSIKSVIGEVSEELGKSNVISSSGALDDLRKLSDALAQPQTFTTLKENRTAFREIVDSTDKADRSQLTSRAKSLLDETYKAITETMEGVARENLTPKEFRQWKRANAVYAEEAVKLTKTKLKNVLDKGDVTPEAVQQMLFSRKPSEQRLLYQSLTNEGRANARSAIISKVVENVSNRQAGLTPNSFSTELKKYGPQVSAFFRGKDKTQLEGLSRVLEATRRAQDAAVTTPTGQQLTGGLYITGLYLDAGATLAVGSTIGGLSRLYESAPVRNALLRLGSMPKTSPKYAQSLLSAQLALQNALRIASDEETDKQPPPQ